MRWMIVALALLAPPAALSAQDRCALEWTLEEDLRIGSLDGPDAMTLLRSVREGPDGRLYVTDFRRPEVLIFAPDGRLEGTFGRAGEGPGDFSEAPVHVGWRNGILWVSDYFRTHSFTADGDPRDFVRFRVHVPSESAIYTPGLPFADDTYHGRRWLAPRPGKIYGAGALEVALRRFDADGAVRDTIAVMDMTGRFVRQSETSFREHPLWEDLPGSHFDDVDEVIARDGSSVVLPGALDTSGERASFEMLRIAIAGDTVARWSVPYQPEPVSSGLEEWLRGISGAFAAGEYSGHLPMAPRSEADRNRARAAAEEYFWMPDFLPPVRDVHVGADDTVWLLRELTEPEGADRWEVFDAAGTLIGRFEVTQGRYGLVPWYPRLRLLDVSRDRVWGATTDDFGVPYIHRFRISDACAPRP